MPFLAAILTVCLTQKNLELRTWMTIVFAVLGIVVVFWGRFGDGNIFAAGETMAGNVLGKGYLAGIGMTIGTVFGRLAGEGASNYVSS